MLKEKNNEEIMNEKVKSRRVIILIVILVFGLLALYLHEQKKNRQESEENLNKMMIMSYISLQGEYKYDKNGYEEFLKDANLPTTLLYFGEYMDTHHPSIGYGTTYKEITVERLTNDYMEVLADITSEDTASIDGDLRRKDGRFKETMEEVYRTIRMDGIWVGYGATKVEVDSAEALMRKAKALCMQYIYIDGYVSEYIFGGYNNMHFEEFLGDERLPIFLTGMKEYMEAHYPEIGYGSQYEEVTVERLRNDYKTVSMELEEMIGKVEDTGVEWSEIAWQIREESDIPLS